MSESQQAQSRWSRARGRALRGLDRGFRLISNAVTDFGRHRGTQLAASMSYYALFSVFPAAIVAAAIAGFVLNDPQAQTKAVDYLFEQLPLSAGQGRNDIESVVTGVANNSGTLGLIGLVTLMISASALMGATRNSLGVIFRSEVRRGALRGKGLDVLLVFVLGLLFTASLAITVLASLEVQLDGWVGGVAPELVSAGIAAGVFAVLYKVLPTQHPGWREMWPGVLFAGLGYEVLKQGFAFYLSRFADYSAVYGSLGTVIAFMFFVYLGSIVFLLGAEMVALWPAVRAGLLDPDPDQEGDPFLVQVREAILGLFRRNRVEEPRRREVR